MDAALALVAAFLFAVAATLQQKGALNLPKISLADPTSLLKLIGQTMWLAGTIALLCGYGVQAVALDDGRLSDSVGHVVDFKNTILIMTSNLGTSFIGKRVSPGFIPEGDDASHEKMKGRVMEELKRAFRPEFVNRIDDTIVFHGLSREDISNIVRLMMMPENGQLADKGITVEPTTAALDLLVEKGYDATYGARQLRRTIQKHVEDPLAEAIVRGQITDGARLELDVEGDNFVFREAQVAEPPLALAEH